MDIATSALIYEIAESYNLKNMNDVWDNDANIINYIERMYERGNVSKEFLNAIVLKTKNGLYELFYGQPST